MIPRSKSGIGSGIGTETGADTDLGCESDRDARRGTGGFVIRDRKAPVAVMVGGGGLTRRVTGMGL